MWWCWWWRWWEDADCDQGDGDGDNQHCYQQMMYAGVTNSWWWEAPSVQLQLAKSLRRFIRCSAPHVWFHKATDVAWKISRIRLTETQNQLRSLTCSRFSRCKFCCLGKPNRTKSCGALRPRFWFWTWTTLVSAVPWLGMSNTSDIHNGAGGVQYPAISSQVCRENSRFWERAHLC